MLFLFSVELCVHCTTNPPFFAVSDDISRLLEGMLFAFSCRLGHKCISIRAVGCLCRTYGARYFSLWTQG